MRIINTNLLNYFYKKGVKPIKDSIANKLDTSKIVNNLLTTVAGFALDARQGPVIQRQIDEINSNLSGLSRLSQIEFGRVAVNYGTTAQQVTVTFQKEFKNSPCVVAIPIGFAYTSHQTHKPCVSIGVVTTTYANINYIASNGGNASIAWIAVS